MKDGRKKFNLGLIGILVLVGLGIGVLMAVAPAGASQTGDAYPGSGDWTINNATRVIDEEVVVDGNIYVNNTLELWNGTIRMSLSYDNQYRLEVMDNGYLKANNSLITSTSNYREYGFPVYGRMDIRTTTVEETYDGIRVMTDKRVHIENCDLLSSYGTGLWLENADNTTVKNSNIQTNDLSVSASVTVADVTSYYDRDRYVTVSGTGGAMYVKGGNPTLDNITVSANGTMTVKVTCRKSYYYAYIHTTCAFPLVGIDSEEMKTVSGIHIRDSEVSINVDYYLTNNYWGGYWYLYTYGSAMAINVLNYGDVTLKGCTANNVGMDDLDVDTYRYGNYVYGTRTYTYDQGMTLFGATVDKMFSTAGPHVFKLTIANMQFADVGVLSASLTPDYNGTTDPTFKTIIVLDNLEVEGGKQPFNFNIAPKFGDMKTVRSHIRISNSTFRNMTGRIFSFSVSPGGSINANVRSFDFYDTQLFENNLVQWCRPGSGAFFYESYTYNQEYNNLYERNLWIRKNTFRDNNGRLLYQGGHRYNCRGFERVTFEDNLVVNNTGDYIMYVYYRNRLKVTGNTFRDNPYSYGIYYQDYGGDHNGKKPSKVNISDNHFEDTYASSADYYNKGLIRARWGGDLVVSDNNFTGVEQCIVNLYEYTYYAGYADFWFERNNLWNNNGTFIYHYMYYDYHQDLTCWIEENTAWDNNGWFTDYYDSYVGQYDFDATIYFRNNTITNSTDKVLREYGALVVTGNSFKDCKGYVIELDYLNLNPPVISDNDIKNCEDVYFIGAKDKGVLKMSLTVSDLNVDCTGNAFYFKRVDVTMDNVHVTDNATVAIIVEDANVDAMHSTIPIGSGQVIGSGEIFVWFEMELFVEWSNKENPDVSSGVPVEEALVVFYGRTGAYYASEYTDDKGHLRPIRLPQWSMRGSFTDVWTPFTINAAKSGVTDNATVDLNMDYTGPDALKILLSDGFIPVIRITSPFPGDLFNVPNITLRGFTTEVGSGVGAVDVAIGDEEWESVTWDDEGNFEFTFVDVPQGDQVVLRARVNDVALNFNETSIVIVVDRTPPNLEIVEPIDNAVYNQTTITITGETEAGAMITINGLERGFNPTMNINIPYNLSEGNNVIVVEATDAAGNSAMVTRHVRLDRFAPTLTVLAPRDGLVTHTTSITVEGDVETNTDVTISVYRSETNLIDEEVTPWDDGTFRHEVDLEEGQNVIVVKSKDDADNWAVVSRVVYLDTTAPLCTITSPAHGTITADNTVRVTGTAEVEGVTLYLNGKQIFNDGTVDRTVNLNEGKNVIELRAVDRIGNDYRHRVTVILDTKPPVIEMNQPVAQHIMTNQETHTISGKVIGFITREQWVSDWGLDAGDYDTWMSGLTISVMDADYTLDLDEASGEATFAIADFTLPEEGENNVLIVARDMADNAATHSIVMDFSTVKPDLVVSFNPPDPDISSEDANLFLYITTTPGIREVKVTHTSGDETEFQTYPVSPEGVASVARTLLEGANTITVEVTDDYGNTKAWTPHTVNYEYKPPKVGTVEEDKIDPASIGVVFLAISIALVATAIVVARSFRKE